jgi:hypothetical protein
MSFVAEGRKQAKIPETSEWNVFCTAEMGTRDNIGKKPDLTYSA